MREATPSAIACATASAIAIAAATGALCEWAASVLAPRAVIFAKQSANDAAVLLCCK
jgi:hypothetical protein